MSAVRRLLLGGAAGLALLLGAATAFAQCPSVPDDTFAFINPGSDRCPADPGVSWPTGSVVYDCSWLAKGDTILDCAGDPSRCVELCHAAANVWNGDLPGRFTFVDGDGSADFCDTEDGKTSVGGTTSLCDGTSYGGNVLAVTLSIFFSNGPQAGQLVDANITVNQDNEQFFVDQGQPSFQATLAHEFGHVLGLAHPDQCNKDFNVLMRSASEFRTSSPCFVLNPTAADLNGARRVYPVVNPTPTPVCGDADGNGELSVSDGVQVLRAAAELSSSCTEARCDVDGNGAISVSDGVNVLRGAAGLSFTAACP
jgi:hypothetical protein